MHKTGEDGRIQLDPVAVGEKFRITEQEARNWISIPPDINGVYTVKRELGDDENELYFANRLKPANLVFIKYEDRNENGQYDEDEGEGLPGRIFKVESIDGPTFFKEVETNETGWAVVPSIPFKSVTGLPDDYPVQRYSITEDTRAGWRSLQSIEEKLHPGEDLSISPRSPLMIENVLLSGNITVRKYEDLNGNNKYDLKEGCPNWAITITGPGANFRAATDENGVAYFNIGFKSDPNRPDDLPRNTYTIHEEPKDGFAVAKDQSVVLGPGEEKTVDIPNVPLPGIILVRKFEDKNGNNRQDSGEEAAGWTFNVIGNGVRNPTADHQ